MPIYMNYNNIAGDVTESGHNNWIEVNSFQWGVGRGISSPTGSSEDRESSAPSVSEITITKEEDNASVKLLTEAYSGTGQTVTFDFCRTNQGALDVYLKFTLTNAMVSGYSISSGGDRPTESISINFTKVEFQATGMAAAGAAGTPSSITYDLAQAKTV